MGNMGNRIITGQLRLTGAADQLVRDDSLNGLSSIAIKAARANVGDAYLGNSSGVTTLTGFQISAGQSISMDLLNANDLYIIGTANDIICYMGLMP